MYQNQVQGATACEVQSKVELAQRREYMEVSVGGSAVVMVYISLKGKNQLYKCVRGPKPEGQ